MLNGATHGFLMSGNNFSTIDFPGSTFTQAIGINDRGQIVGEYRTSAADAGFLATPGSGASSEPPDAAAEQTRRE